MEGKDFQLTINAFNGLLESEDGIFSENLQKFQGSVNTLWSDSLTRSLTDEEISKTQQMKDLLPMLESAKYIRNKDIQTFNHRLFMGLEKSEVRRALDYLDEEETEFYYTLLQDELNYLMLENILDQEELEEDPLLKRSEQEIEEYLKKLKKTEKKARGLQNFFEDPYFNHPVSVKNIDNNFYQNSFNILSTQILQGEDRANDLINLTQLTTCKELE